MECVNRKALQLFVHLHNLFYLWQQTNQHS